MLIHLHCIDKIVGGICGLVRFYRCEMCLYFISIFDLYIDINLLRYKKGGKNMGYPKKHRGRRKIGSKKRRARKRNKKK